MQGVARRYEVGDTVVTALQDVDLTVDAGEFVVVLGPSGSGKTTLLNLIGALDVPTEGDVRVAGATITGAAPQGAVPVPAADGQLRVPDVQPVPGAHGRGRTCSSPST